MFAYNRKSHLVIPRLTDDDLVTKPDMAFSLRDINQLVQEGKPVSNSNLSNDYYEGSQTTDPTVAFEHRRGVDLNDAWNASKAAQKQLSTVQSAKIDLNPSN